MSAQASPSHGEGSSHGGDHSQGPPRKKMRKGTKSCIECRRRKIKCTFEPGRTQICNECFARGSTCIDQEHGDVSSFTQGAAGTSNETNHLKERVNSLEDMLKQVLDRLPDKSEAYTAVREAANHVDTQAAEVLKSLRASPRTRESVEENMYLHKGARESVPVLSLFDNAVITTREEPQVMSREQYNKSKTLIAALLKLLPPISDLEIILESSQEWWTIWKTMFPDITDRRCVTIKESVSHSLRSENPAEVGKIMLCIALSIHQLSPEFDWTRVSIKETPAQVMERYITTVDRLIITDDEIAASVDGIECMILAAKWHINMGRPRKSWLMYQRASAFSQLLGLHRLHMTRGKKNDAQFERQLLLWCHLIMGDRYLSLVLGLPYLINDAFAAPALKMAKTDSSRTGLAELYVVDLLPMITRMIERNQNPSGTPYAVTMSMDQELEELRNKTNPSWWTTEQLPGSTVEEHFERLQAQFFHHHARVLLHMPFMLRSAADKRYQYSHGACLESARDMIRYYDALRGSESIGPHACRLIDFQAFTAAMLLLLNLIGYSQHYRGAVPQQPDLDQDQQDSTLIDRCIHLLKEAGLEAGGSVAVNSAQALEMLASARHGCTEEATNCPESCQVSIPYFGNISIRKGKQFVPVKPGTYPQAKNERASHLRPAVTSQTGLPTPPSMASTSCQQSPQDSMLSLENPRQSPYYNNSDSIVHGINQPWTGSDDPLITFDSFMAFPGAQTIDFTGLSSSTSDRLTGGSGSTDFTTMGAFSGVGTLDEQNMVAGYPFPVVGGNHVELDQGWNWFGVGAPTI